MRDELDAWVMIIGEYGGSGTSPGGAPSMNAEMVATLSEDMVDEVK